MTVRSASTTHAAYVLHHYDWSESSQIVELFTRDAGRVAVVAKGAKRPTSQLRAVLMPFQRIAVTLGRSRTDSHAEIHTLRGAEWAGGTPAGGAEALLAGFYVNELVLKFLARDDPHPALWDAYAATLPRLGGAGEAAALRAFELVLLREAGLLPDLARATATQASLEPHARYALRPEIGIGSALRTDDAALPGAAWLALQAALDGTDLEPLCAACAADPAPLRQQLRALLAYHLAGTPLRTRELAHQLQSLLQAR
jgi:DNA repair protein RecO (recombination protein O)